MRLLILVYGLASMLRNGFDLRITLLAAALASAMLKLSVCKHDSRTQREEMDNLRSRVADQYLKIQTLRRTLSFLGFAVNIEDE